MNDDETRQFIIETYNLAFARIPTEKEIGIYLPKIQREILSPLKFIRLFANTAEYRAKHAVSSVFPMGHYHSPVVDPRTVSEYVEIQHSLSLADLSGISINLDAMRQLWLKNLEFTKNHPFTREPNMNDRFRYGDGPFPEGDAIAIQLIFAEFRPEKVVEIGSGFSTACMLDSAERVGLGDISLVCIEPYPERLLSMLRPTDSVKILEKRVQEVDKSIVDSLKANDILFIDSTHVMKTGSDVHFEFFSLMPRLRSGVIVHFHDIGYLFEYPNKWIYDFNYSWNEAYVLRAFLMYNTEFEIIFWHSLLRDHFTVDMNTELPVVSKNNGSSIWLRRK